MWKHAQFLTFFYSCHVFYVFNVFFYFAQRFLFLKKTCIENPIKSFEKHFWNHNKEIGLIGHSDAFNLVSPNILKCFLTNLLG